MSPTLSPLVQQQQPPLRQQGLLKRKKKGGRNKGKKSLFKSLTVLKEDTLQARIYVSKVFLQIKKNEEINVSFLICAILESLSI